MLQKYLLNLPQPIHYYFHPIPLPIPVPRYIPHNLLDLIFHLPLFLNDEIF